MNLPTFVMRNAMRNKKRTLLTVLSIGFSLFLLLTLMTLLNQLFNRKGGEKSDFRLVTCRSTSMADAMPLAYVDRIRSVDRVKEAVAFQWFAGYYLEEKNQFPNFAVDQERLFAVFPEIVIPDERKKVFLETHNGAIASDKLAEKYGWKLGDVITLKGVLFPIDAELELCGFYHSVSGDNKALYFHYEYLNQALGGDFHTVASVWSIADDPDDLPGIAEKIDEMFRNSPAETKTDSEKAFVLNVVGMIGNIKALIGGIASAVVFTMMLVAVSTMAMIVRERYREVGVLKAMGYPARLVMAMLVGESVFISLLAVALAIGGAFALSFQDIEAVLPGLMQRFDPGVKGYGMALGVGLGIGLVAGIIPAYMASRLTITGAIRRLE